MQEQFSTRMKKSICDKSENAVETDFCLRYPDFRLSYSYSQ